MTERSGGLIDDREPRATDPIPDTPEIRERAVVLAQDLDRELAKYAQPTGLAAVGLRLSEEHIMVTRANLEAAGQLIGDETGQLSLDSASWEAWNVAHQGEQGSAIGKVPNAAKAARPLPTAKAVKQIIETAVGGPRRVMNIGHLKKVSDTDLDTLDAYYADQATNGKDNAARMSAAATRQALASERKSRTATKPPPSDDDKVAQIMKDRAAVEARERVRRDAPGWKPTEVKASPLKAPRWPGADTASGRSRTR